LRREIRHLDQEHDGLRDRLTQMAEHVEDAGNVIERWRETFGMEMAEGGGWTWAPFWKEWDRSINEHDKLVRDYNALVRLWNSYFAVINGASEKQRKPVGRPLAAEEGEIARVQKLHKEGRSLRGIAEDTELSFSTVRSIVDKIEGTDRGTKKALAAAAPGGEVEGARIHPYRHRPAEDHRPEAAAPHRQRTTEASAAPHQGRSRVGEGGETVRSVLATPSCARKPRG
jgi:hypothetical protein